MSPVGRTPSDADSIILALCVSPRRAQVDPKRKFGLPISVPQGSFSAKHFISECRKLVSVFRHSFSRENEFKTTATRNSGSLAETRRRAGRQWPSDHMEFSAVLERLWRRPTGKGTAVVIVLESKWLVVVVNVRCTVQEPFQLSFQCKLNLLDVRKMNKPTRSG